MNDDERRQLWGDIVGRKTPLQPEVTLTEAVEGFAERMARGEFTAAVAFARLADLRWEQMCSRQGVRREHTVGSPLADEAQGWLDWTGGTA